MFVGVTTIPRVRGPTRPESGHLNLQSAAFLLRESLPRPDLDGRRPIARLTGRSPRARRSQHRTRRAARSGGVPHQRQDASTSSPPVLALAPAGHLYSHSTRLETGPFPFAAVTDGRGRRHGHHDHACPSSGGLQGRRPRYFQQSETLALRAHMSAGTAVRAPGLRVRPAGTRGTGQPGWDIPWSPTVLNRGILLRWWFGR